MSWAEKTRQGIEDWFTKPPAPDKPSWKDRIRGWMAAWFEKGIVQVMDFLEPDLRAEIKPSLLRLREIEGMPDDLKDLIDKTITEPKAIHLAAILPYLIGIMVGLGMGAAAPMSRIGAYQIDGLVKSARVDPAAWITAFRRKYKDFADITDDLKDQGWSPERIEALKFFTLFAPSAMDIVSWYAREVYEPDMVTKYGLDDELPEYEKTDFPKIGVDSTQATNFWRAHWQHPELRTIIEMLRRTDFTEDDMREWFRLVEIPPFWRDKLIQISYEVPTRVDVRRWWDMRTISEERLREIYVHQGYHGDDLEDYIRWTKVYTDFPMMMARFKNGWITEDDIRSWLQGLDIPAERIEHFIQEKTKPVKDDRVAGDRDLTMSLIVSGVKKGVITPAEGIELLMNLGYDEDEAEFILKVRVEAATGSPENMEEFRDITQKYRKAVGQEAKEVTEELKKAASELARVTEEVAALAGAAAAEKKTLIDEEVLPEAATERLTELQVALHRAEAKLQAAQVHYNALLAEWKYKEG